MLRDVPEIYSFCFLSYSRTSLLQYGDWNVESQVGVQQSDPIGPLLFCLTIQPLLGSLRSTLKAGYLDDITLGGPAQIVAADVHTVLREGQDLGLNLNVGKCEMIRGRFSGSLDPTVASFITVDPSAAVLLGAPISTGASMDNAHLIKVLPQ